MMGANSVRYHAETVLARGDDHRGSALEYYGSRGETPLRWGGSGAASLGLEGRVSAGQYEATYGPGGASDPKSWSRLVTTTRPGMEIVIAAHKSVAELGVIGRADDMHKIMDAERDATMGYLDAVVRARGGRRGRAAVSVSTTGLVYAQTRHATSRAGDPAPHDHMLLANVIHMLDEKGGHKAPDTTLWRDHLHAATMVGRLAAAKAALDLGYAIEADPGPSGRLGHWRIAGVPTAVMELHSKRAAQIEAECLEKGYATYRSRQIAARSTRGHKRHEPIDDLLARWRTEVTEAGYPPRVLADEVTRAGHERAALRALTAEELRDLVEAELSAEGTLGRRKVFSGPDVVVALAPHLYGQDPALLQKAVARVLSDPETIPLIGVPGARERVFTTARTLAVEQAISDTLARQITRTDAPVVGPQVLARAQSAAEEALGHPLTAGQEEAVWAICSSGRGAEVVLGIAGSGKTTALDVVRRGFEDAGCTVIGTAISGTAARTLGEEAGIETSRTLASICWRLEHHRLELTERHVVVLDEAGMTDDPNLLRLLGAAEGARAKVILVGDHHQLGPVGPGGAFEGLLRRHQGVVQVLTDNVRQREPEEARALLALRGGDVAHAVSFYVGHQRLRTAETRDEALQRAVEAWAQDVTEGKDAVLMAWRRANVAELNARARVVMEELGVLFGPELVAPGGRAYRAGDPVVVLAPVPEAGLVTSERAEVAGVEENAQRLHLRTRTGREVVLSGEEISAERLDHAYGLTVHRMQGATAEVAHLYADGGGRELAYVGLSRAKDASYLYLAADDVSQAADDLRREWALSARPRWATDVGRPEWGATKRVPELSAAQMAAVELEWYRASRPAFAAAIPVDHSARLAEMKRQLHGLERDLADLDTGRGIWERTELAGAAHTLNYARHQRQSEEHRLRWAKGLREHHRGRRNLAEWKRREEAASLVHAKLADPHRAEVAVQVEALRPAVAELEARIEVGRAWSAEHPEAATQLARTDFQITALDRDLARGRWQMDNPRPLTEDRTAARSPGHVPYTRTPSPHRDLGYGRGL